MQSEQCDILVIGSGIAGLSFALHCAEYFEDKKIVVLSKGSLRESNTRYAQGGIAAVTDHQHDSCPLHVSDTLIAGDGLCNRKIVELVVKRAPGEIQNLMRWGVRFDLHGQSSDLGREGGHSSSRILHCKDRTGANIIASLIQRAREKHNISLLEDRFVSELITGNEAGKKICLGALVRNGSLVSRIYASYTMLATGGAGQVYALTSNPEIATGDGIALARQAGAQIRDMAFVQFHPTVLYETKTKHPFLISEALRGFGAILRNHEGDNFMYRYDIRGSLATRDIVTRAIFSEIQRSGKEHLWLDLRHLDTRAFALKFPTIARRLQKLHINVTTDMIPVVPAAHYFCGGIATDRWARTSVPRLLACGECSRTGLHGANRLASNSLPEALVFARQACKKLKVSFRKAGIPHHSNSMCSGKEPEADYPALRWELQHIMTRYAGIIRGKEGLLYARERILRVKSKIPDGSPGMHATEFHNMCTVALEIIEDSLQQPENRGVFFCNDLICLAE